MSRNADLQMITLLRDRNTRDEGFKLLMNTYKKKLYWYIRRLVISHEDAEDIFQETFINVYKYAGNFNGDSRIYTWLYRIATNECIRHFERRKKQLQKVELTAILMNSIETTIEEDEKYILVQFQKAILRLPEKQRIVFNMRYYDGMSYKEMAEILHTSESALKTSYHYAAEKIKAYLKEIE